jgi:23S rRNA (pseudouridine1915-N3)-methyltransferase
MQHTLLAVGITREAWLRTGTADYADRLRHYTRFTYLETPDLKLRGAKGTPDVVREGEAALIERALAGVDHLILLDERGTAYDSPGLARHIAALQQRSLKHVCWVIGGPYGFHERIRARSHGSWSLGPLTFSHQMIRPFAAEQLYLAHTILAGEPYHHA